MVSPSSSKPVMEGPNHGNEMTHHERSKSRTPRLLYLDVHTVRK